MDWDAVEGHRRLVVELSKPGGVLAKNAPNATVRNPEWFIQRGSDEGKPEPARRRLHNRLVAERLVGGVPGGREAIVLAGPPGAGKSTVLGEVLGSRRDEFLVIDADDFKVALLRDAMRDGSYETVIKPPQIRDREAGGEKFFPLELASLVHEESSILADRMRAAAIHEGVNIVVDTVLSSQESADRWGRQLAAAGYRVEVVNVEVPYGISEARIAKRWQQSYVDAVEGRGELGGRWVPSEYTRDVFAGPGGESKSEAVARTFAEECVVVERYRVYRTTVDAIGTTPAVGSWEKDLLRGSVFGVGAVKSHAGSTRSGLPAGTVEGGEMGSAAVPSPAAQRVRGHITQDKRPDPGR
ncbi:MAG: zeta toxin family protein [Rhodoglobus sp.]